jgi:hypothetical protein
MEEKDAVGSLADTDNRRGDSNGMGPGLPLPLLVGHGLASIPEGTGSWYHSSVGFRKAVVSGPGRTVR